MKKDTFYFSHDYNARQDQKIKKLRQRHGMRGYGIFWSIIEDLYCNANALQTDYDSIAFDLHEEAELVKSVIEDFDLFEIENGHFGSMSVQDRLDERSSKSRKARESSKIRWEKAKKESERNANAMRTHTDRNAIKERKVKESKGKESKEDMAEAKASADLDFEIVWDLYDHKKNKATAKRKWKALKPKDQEAALEHIPKFVEATPDTQFRPHFATYINQRRWEDEHLPNVNGKPKHKYEFDENGNLIL